MNSKEKIFKNIAIAHTIYGLFLLVIAPLLGIFTYGFSSFAVFFLNSTNTSELRNGLIYITAIMIILLLLQGFYHLWTARQLRKDAKYAAWFSFAGIIWLFATYSGFIDLFFGGWLIIAWIVYLRKNGWPVYPLPVLPSKRKIAAILAVSTALISSIYIYDFFITSTSKTKKFMPDNPYAIYIYSYGKGMYGIVQHNGIEGGCIYQNSIRLASEHPSTGVLKKSDVSDFLQNTQDRKFTKSNYYICFKNSKIYSKYATLYAPSKWEIEMGKNTVYECNSTATKHIFIFQKYRDTIHSSCLDKSHKYSLSFDYAEGIGNYQNLVSIYTVDSNGSLSLVKGEEFKTSRQTDLNGTIN